LYKKILLLVLVVAAMYAAWQLQQFLQIKIGPRKSMYRFLLFLLLNLTGLFLLIFLLTFIIIHLKDFFFTP